MDAGFAKRLAPRSLYARAALILLVPILTIQIVVTIVFIQRLYEDVTEQMTGNALYDLEYVLEAVAAAGNRREAARALAALAPPFDFDTTMPDSPPAGDTRVWYDLSGRAVIDTLRSELEGVIAVDLASSLRRVGLTVATEHGPVALDFSRRRVSASNPHQLLVLMALTSILMTIIAFVYLRNQLRPVKRLAEAAEAFGRGQVVEFRPAGATEMRAAGAAFLDMRMRIERMIEQRTLMLSGVSHDLRTPLTRLRLALTLQDENEATVAMQRDIKDMEELLATFLDFARGDAMDERADVDPARLLGEVRDRWRASGNDVDVIADGPLPCITASPGALARALENLVANAVRYGSRARLSAAVGPRSIRLSVEDDGPGIPAGDRAEAMKPFARLDSARNQDRGPGVGLGLAIAHDIARRHGGRLSLSDSAALGGLKAEIVLPK
jgi:two-component system osmolarity sensor histidine kinase EnvZ